MIQNDQRKTKYIETVLYGIAGMTFAVAFFFGIMYPELGRAQGAYRVEEHCSYDVSDLEEPFCDRMLTKVKCPVGEETVIYTSYFYECLKKKESKQ